jgi:phosphoserine phosphatase RsbU/P
MEILSAISGILLTSLLWFYKHKKNRKTNNLLSDRIVRLEQEKEIVVNFMHNLAVAIGEGIAKKDLYHRIAHTAVITTGAMSACIYEKLPNKRLQGVAVEGLFPPQRTIKNLVDKDSSEPRARFLEKVLNSEILEEGEGIVGQVSKTGKSVYIENALADPRVVKHADPSLVVKSIIYSPLVHNDKTMGVLVVANPANGLAFTETDFSLVNSIAEQSALAIRNSDAMNLRISKSRMDSDLRLASEVQELFLTQNFPDCKGLEISAHYVPSAQVGGDFYDFKKLSSHKFAVSIADVSGKGVPASLLMALCQTNLRHYLTKSRQPSDVLKKLNSELEHRIREDMFITVFLAIIDTENNTLTYSRAGHEPALLSTGSNPCKVNKLNGSGMAVGMVPQEVFEEMIEDYTVPFTPENALTLYTDGITEAENHEQEEFGVTRLAECLKSYSPLAPAELNTKILEKMEKFATADSDRDDLTLLTVKRVEKS